MKKIAKLRNIFISSIYQNAGKTTLALGLYKLFKEKKLRTSFLKPVGQQTVTYHDHDIDKDSYLIGEVYHCQKQMIDMSPVTIGHGFTENYIFNPRKEELRLRIVTAFRHLIKNKDAIIIEGTGHAGVGSVIDLSNADVASLLGSKVILIAEGGIGKSIDEITLNKALFDLRHVEVLGVVVNKVLPEKYHKIKRVLTRGLKNKGLRLLGVIPIDPLLSAPTVEEILDRFNLKILCGKKSLSRRVLHTIVAAMEPHNMINYLQPGTLVLTSGDRVDNIMVAVSSHLVMSGKSSQVSGIILTGGLVPNTKILELLRKSRIPVLLSQHDTYTIAGRIENLICKIQKTDKDKILEATQLIKQYVDVDTILNEL